MASKKAFYVYRIFDGFETRYVGKGSGRRLEAQKRKFRCDGEIVEECKSDDHAFDRERVWIDQLKPTENKHPGGNGRRCKKRAVRRDRTEIEMEVVGPRRYTARYLLTKIDETNCEAYDVSKVDVSRLREVANGPWC